MNPSLSRRQFLRRVSLGGAAALLAACGGEPAAPSDTAQTTPAAGAAATQPAVEATQPAAADTQVPATSGAAKQVVRFTMFGHPQIAEQMVEEFNKANPDIEVQFERSEGQGYGEKITAALSSGDAWDVFRAPATFPTRFGPKGVLEDLSPYISADTKYPASGYLDGALDTWKVEGKIYGIPVWALTMWLFYNKKLFDAAGVAYPTPQTTWEEYAAMAEKLTVRDGSGAVTQYGSNGFGGWTLPVAQDVWSGGGCFYYTDDKTKICVDDPKTIKVLGDEAALMNVAKVHPSPLNPPSSPVSLLSGKVASELNGNWLPWDNHEQWSDDFDATLTPLRDGKRVNCYFPDAFVMNSASQVKEAAYRWIAWWANDPASWALQGKVVAPAVKAQYENPELSKAWLVKPYPPGLIAQIEEHAKTARLWSAEPHADQFENEVWYPEIDKLWRNVASAEEVAKTITAKGNELLAKPIE
jgi:multiple sugar transport system substrate-binding protein